MSLVIRNSTTGMKTEYAAWEQSAYQLLNSTKNTRNMKRMKEIRYRGEANTEVYGRMCDVRIDALKQTTGIPKLDCSEICPADTTLLRTFQSVCGVMLDDESTMGVQRFVMKPRWYRVFDASGNILKTDPETLRKYFKVGVRIDIEYHMNYIRIVGTDTEVPCGDPIVRKITFRKQNTN